MDGRRGLSLLMLSETYNIDCMAGMKAAPDKYWDLAIVDPPYGIGDYNQSDAKQGRVTWNNLPPAHEYFEELERVSRRQIVWGSNYYGRVFGEGGVLVWDKDKAHPCYSQVEVAALSFQKRCDYVFICWQSGWYRARYENIIHPCQKPVALYKWLLTNYAKPGDTILDTHLGSGSSRIAAYDLGFAFTGYELDKDYFDAQEARFARHIAQARLFEPEPVASEQTKLF